MDPDENTPASTILKEALSYSKPLMVYSVVGFVYMFADRWLLQRFGGAQQQGFFSIGQQFTAASMLATASIVNVMWKEVAEAIERGDRERMHRLFWTTRRVLYFVTLWMSCGLAPFSPEIVRLAAGESYRGAAVTTALLLMVPVHQTLGQIQGTFLIASGRTATYSRLGIVTMVLSLPVTYFVLASPEAAVPGMGLAAAGLAIKVIGVQFIGVSLQLVAIVRAGIGHFDVAYQFGSLGLLLSIGCLSKLAVAGGMGSTSTLARLIVGGSVYVLGTVLLVSLVPWVTGVSAESARRHLPQRIHSWIYGSRS